MTIRAKFVATFVVVAVVVATLVGVFSVLVTARTLRGEIDRSLVSAAATLSAGGTLVTPAGSAPVDSDGRLRPGYEGIVQSGRSIAPDGTTKQLVGVDLGIPVTPADLALAAPTTAAGVIRLTNTTTGGTEFRVLTQALGSGKGAIQVVRDASESGRVLGRLVGATAIIGLIVVLVAAFAGWFVGRRITRRLTTLSGIAEEVSRTGRLDLEIPEHGRDEVSRLGTSFQSMLTELASSRDDQQRLVENAGHELRTPLTSLRTNLAVLRRFGELPAESRSRLLDDVEGETRELTNLVNELVELATDRRDSEPASPVDLAALAERVAERFRRRSGRAIVVVANGSDTNRSPTNRAASAVMARPQGVERALSNLLDNALKFDPGPDPIEVRIRHRSITVLDRGPGLSPEDTDLLFDRFYRSAAARSMPGSGLGLSIVREVAAQHGGAVSAANRPGGGASIGFTLGDEPAGFLPDPKPDHAGG